MLSYVDALFPIEPPAGVIVLGVDTPKRKSCEYPKSETARE